MKAWHIVVSVPAAAILGTLAGTLFFGDREILSFLTIFLVTLVLAPLLALSLARWAR